MAKAKKLPSGSWRTLESKKINGVMVRRSFTVSPNEFPGDPREASKKARNLSELRARMWKDELEDFASGNITVKIALDKYINDRSNVLSPSTLRSYKLMLPSLAPLYSMSALQVCTEDIQRLVNDMALDVKMKTIKNRIGLLISALDYANNHTKFKIRYPEDDSKKVESPQTDEIYCFLANCSGEMQLAVALAAFGSLRRSEICALKYGDISRDMNLISIHAALVLGENGYVYKNFTKTKGSTRSVELPSFVLDLIPLGRPNDFIISELTPAAISDRFERLAKKLHIDASFHSLRHFAASFRSDLGIPKKYIEELGGWAPGSSILPEHYDDTIASSRRKFTRIANNYLEENFSEIFQTKKA